MYSAADRTGTTHRTPIRVGLAIAAMTVAPIAAATDLTVFPGQSIQAAIDAAVPGDRVLVMPGTYAEAIDFRGKAIEVIGVDGAESTVLNATGLATSVVHFSGGEVDTSVLTGFTITGGAAVDGGGVLIESASPIVRECVIQGNTASGKGGGVAVRSIAFLPAPPWGRLDRCVVDGNAAAAGGGVWLGISVSSFEVRESTVIGNLASGDGGGLLLEGASNTVVDTHIRGNQAAGLGGGLAALNRSNQVTRCTVDQNVAARGGGLAYRFHTASTLPAYFLVTATILRDNQATQSGGGVYSDIGGGTFFFGPTTVVTQCTLYANSAPTGPAIDMLGVGTLVKTMVQNSIVWAHAAPPITAQGAMQVTFSDVQGGYSGIGNIQSDPLFEDEAAGDLHLSLASPCIDAGGGTAFNSDTDFEGDAITGATDMGADERRRRIYVLGTPALGATVTFKAIGQPGEPVFLFAAAGLRDTPLTVPGFGVFLLQTPLSPGFPAPLPAIPANGTLAIPVHVPAVALPGSVAIQAIIGPVLTNAEPFDL